MNYKTVDKSQFNMRLSTFLSNGLEVVSAQLGINKSEVMRMALYNMLSQLYTKKEMDLFASRQDVVDEWMEYLKQPLKYRVYGEKEEQAIDDKTFIERELRKDEVTDEFDKYQDTYQDELDKRLKKIKKKYSYPYAEDFMRATNMNPKEASEYFNNYNEKNRDEHKKYQKEMDEYFEKEYPKEQKELEKKVDRLLGVTSEEKTLWYLQERLKYYQDIIDDGEEYYGKVIVENAKHQLQQYKVRIKKFKDRQDLEKYKEKYLKKYADDPGLVKLIEQVEDPDVFNSIRGVRNPQAVYQILMPAYDISAKNIDKYTKNEEEDKKEKHVKKKKK